MVIGKHFSKYYLKYWYFFLLGIIALIVVDYFQLLIPEYVGIIVDGMNQEMIELGKNAPLTNDTLKEIVLKMCLVALVVFSGRFLWRICIFGNGIRIETDIRNEMFKHMELLSPTFYQTNKTGALMSLYTNDLSTISRSFAGGTLMLVDALSLGILAMIKMIRINKVLLLVCMVPLFLVCLISMIMRKRISRKTLKNLEAFAGMCDYVQEDFSGISVVKAYVKEKRREFLFLDHDQANMDTCLTMVSDQALLGALIGTIVSICSLLIVFTGGYFIYQASTGNVIFDLSVGQLVTFNALFGSLIWPVQAIGELINLRGQSKASEKRVSELLDTKVEINDDNVLEEYKDLSVSDIKGDIKFNELDFTYPCSDVEILHGVSFHINAGEMVGIMGATGSGKSSIVEVMLRLYNLSDGKVFIDDKDIMKLPIKLVRDAIAYVPQETFLFKQTIDENISFAFEEMDKEKNHAYAISSGLSSDIEEFNDGFDTVLGERGVTVSGGQKQRISIARALIKDAPILIMDDSLSAVDTITEDFILNEIRRLRNGKTTIIIAHRITTLESLDKIIVIDDGKVSDIGTHEELLDRNEIYKREVHLQELEKELEVK